MKEKTIYYKNPLTGDSGSVVLRGQGHGAELIINENETTKNFTVLTGVQDIIAMAVKSETPIIVSAFGPMSEQEQCNLDVGKIPLGTFSNDFPLMLNQSVLTFKQVTEPFESRPGKLTVDKYLGEIVAIDAR